eukprot:gnl/TRDRNA2_/TRDRNA2_78913_c0_seq1.p1 gnl/TRDRNA2_/TRDRNA2_78913_c0~~gnl/TRDRNA2_/TRDRNA2_78913_c0_seq1.p1  ORF type:complete len:113 (+),score=17.80 gnl/TRDRNA2_/TRDRNA2_78913_c0_seq1:3-341(+)
MTFENMTLEAIRNGSLSEALQAEVFSRQPASRIPMPRMAHATDSASSLPPLAPTDLSDDKLFQSMHMQVLEESAEKSLDSTGMNGREVYHSAHRVNPGPEPTWRAKACCGSR